MTITLTAVGLCLIPAAVIGVKAALLGQAILDEVNAKQPPEKRRSFLTAWNTAEVFSVHRRYYPASAKTKLASTYNRAVLGLGGLGMILFLVLGYFGV